MLYPVILVILDEKITLRQATATQMEADMFVSLSEMLISMGSGPNTWLRTVTSYHLVPTWSPLSMHSNWLILHMSHTEQTSLSLSFLQILCISIDYFCPYCVFRQSGILVS